MRAFCIFRKKKDCSQYSTAIYNVPPKFSEDAIKKLRQSGKTIISVDDNDSSASTIVMSDDVQNIAQENEQSFVVDLS